MQDIQLGIYQHYKGKKYRVLGCATHSETMEEYVVYQTCGGEISQKGHLWIRPKGIFLEQVEVQGTLEPRFTLLEERCDMNLIGGSREV